MTRLRLLMTSVLREMGRGRPCSFKKRPQALHSTEPDSSRRQSGVVLVVQFWHTGWQRSAPRWTCIIDCDKVISQTTFGRGHVARGTAVTTAARRAYRRVCVSASGGGRGGCVGHAVARESARRSAVGGQRGVEIEKLEAAPRPIRREGATGGQLDAQARLAPSRRRRARGLDCTHLCGGDALSDSARAPIMALSV